MAKLYINIISVIEISYIGMFQDIYLSLFEIFPKTTKYIPRKRIVRSKGQTYLRFSKKILGALQKVYTNF